MRTPRTCPRTRSTPSGVPEADKTALLADWSARVLAAPSVDHVDASVFAMQEHTFYADLAGTVTTQKRVRIEPEVTAVGLGPDGGFETMRTLAPPTGRGWEYLRGPADGGPPTWDWDRELAELPDAARRAARRTVGRGGTLRPRRRPDQPVADDPRVHRPRHRARPCARLRGQLRRDLVRDVRPARHAAVRLVAHARDRGPHRRARAGHRRVGRRGGGRAAVRPRAGRRPGRVPARPCDGAPQGLRAVQRLRVRGLGAARAHPADGERVAAAGRRRARPGHPARRRRRRSVRRGRQELVDRHAALQLPVHRSALLPGARRTAGRPGEGRRVPGQHDRVLGVDERGGRTRRRTTRAGPSTAARASRDRPPPSPTAARWHGSTRSTSSTRCRRQGDDGGAAAGPRRARAVAVEHRRLRRRRARDQHGQPALRRQHAHHQRRDARSLAHRRRRRGRRRGRRQRRAVAQQRRPGRGRAGRTGRGGSGTRGRSGRGRSAAGPPGPGRADGGLGRRAAGDHQCRARRLRPRPRHDVRPGPGRGRRAVRLRRARPEHHLPGHVDRRTPAARAAGRPGRADREVARAHQVDVRRPRHARLHRRRRARRCTPR